MTVPGCWDPLGGEPEGLLGISFSLAVPSGSCSAVGVLEVKAVSQMVDSTMVVNSVGQLRRKARLKVISQNIMSLS